MQNEENQTLKSTRSNRNADARRDFDGFDVDEELVRFRFALKQGDWRAAAELAANIDEHLSRSGPLPVAWLGLPCEYSSIGSRIRGALDRAKMMKSDQVNEVVGGYVDIGSVA
jgi:hypothetical protein